MVTHNYFVIYAQSVESEVALASRRCVDAGRGLICGRTAIVSRNYSLSECHI
jgi:hypothetical protein